MGTGSYSRTLNYLLDNYPSSACMRPHKHHMKSFCGDGDNGCVRYPACKLRIHKLELYPFGFVSSYHVCRTTEWTNSLPFYAFAWWNNPIMSPCSSLPSSSREYKDKIEFNEFIKYSNATFRRHWNFPHTLCSYEVMELVEHNQSFHHRTPWSEIFLKDVVWKFLHSPAFISHPPTLIDSIRRATHPLLEFVLLNFQTACMSLWPLWLRNSNSDEDVCVWSVHAVCFGIPNSNLMESIPPHSRKRAIRARTISKEEPTRHLLFRPIHLTSIELVLERKRRRNCHGVGGIKPHSGMIGKRSIAIRSVRSYSV